MAVFPAIKKFVIVERHTGVGKSRKDGKRFSVALNYDFGLKPDHPILTIKVRSPFEPNFRAYIA